MIEHFNFTVISAFIRVTLQCIGIINSLLLPSPLYQFYTNHYECATM